MIHSAHAVIQFPGSDKRISDAGWSIGCGRHQNVAGLPIASWTPPSLGNNDRIRRGFDVIIVLGVYSRAEL